MFIERKANQKTGRVEFWKARWEPGPPAKKIFVEKVCDETEIPAVDDTVAAKTFAVCWADDRTMGNIAVSSPEMMGIFKDKQGTDAILPCDFVSAGKFRNGATRLWCRTHQKHWGTKADEKSLDDTGEMHCANHIQGMNYVVDPQTIDVAEYAEVGIWCSLPAAIASNPIKTRVPRIHVHLRERSGGEKQIDGDYPAISLLYDSKLDLFKSASIKRVNITPPAALEFIVGLEQGKEMDCINCTNCGFPHLDMGSFAETPHRKHFCAACGRDSTWSKKPIVSTPLKPLHDTFLMNADKISPDRKLNLDEYAADHDFRVWASTPAIVWTADRPQEVGIHAHVEKKDGERIFDDTFSEVIYQGESLKRGDLLQKMLKNAV
ncbi:hypothetical protein [uncultured Parasphingopyxis sp.]|uniref:hypothetical protein n=1 Tax=uncultured Parasphingopyxis sp. TaxID=1547918 RepID=UPI00263776AF|nr:hypothetical protein [uncultured Parasphingopyxis sp.]